MVASIKNHSYFLYFNFCLLSLKVNVKIIFCTLFLHSDTDVSSGDLGENKILCVR